MLSPSKACLSPVPLCMTLLQTSKACQRVGDKSWIVLAAAGLCGRLKLMTSLKPYMNKEYMSSRKSKLGFLSFDNTYMAYVRPQM